MFDSTAMVPHIARDVVQQGVNIGEIVGPIFIGNSLNYLLFGTLIMQLNTYYRNFPNDRLALRALVYTVFFMDLVQTVLLTQNGWWFIITAWGSPEMFTQVVWSASVIPIMTGLISAVVQIFYAWRIWTLTSSLFMHGISILVVLIAVMQCTIATVAGSIVSRNPLLTTLLGLSNEFSTWLAGSFVADIIITACMTYILTQARNRSSWAASETMLTKLVNRVIQSGAATVVIAAVDLALFVQLPETNYFYVPSYILGKIYTNSFMLNLNLRRPNGPGPYGDQTLPLSTLRADGVHVERSTHRDAEEGDIKWVPTDPAASNKQHRVDIHRV